jgi:signal transduction histidine kinase
LLRRKIVTGVIHDLSSQKEQQRDLQIAYDRVSQIRKELIDLNNDLERRVEEKTGSLSQAYQQLEEQHRALQSLDNLKSDFVTMVSHELRAPLTNISGGIELVLASKNQMNAGSRNSLQLVQAEIQRLTRIVESILDLSALDSGKMPIYPEPIQIEDLLPSVQGLINQYRDGTRFQYDIPNDLPIFLADPQALISVLSYILDNAVKYAPQGPIILSALAQGNQIEFCVTDEGPGIPTKVIDQIFDKFYREDNSDARDIYGRGLGLYMAKRLIEAMSGTITAANRTEGGAVFSIRLPIMADAYEKENPVRG